VPLDAMIAIFFEATESSFVSDAAGAVTEKSPYPLRAPAA
jgi:hypothetical protein